MLSGVERDESGKVVGSAAVMFVYILKDQANITNKKGQPVSAFNVLAIARFFDVLIRSISYSSLLSFYISIALELEKSQRFCGNRVKFLIPVISRNQKPKVRVLCHWERV